MGAENGLPEASRRSTIQDIAAAAGVSVASVSYALNGKPGVSEATRERILAVAREHAWEPHQQARALHRAQTDTIGFVVPAPHEALAQETFWMLFISGLEQELRTHDKSLLLHTEPSLAVELDIYRRWRNRTAVDAVVLTDLRRDDARLPVLKEIGLPAVLAGRPDPDLGLSYCYAHDGYDMEQLLHHLHGLGLRRYARLAGDAGYLIVGERAATCDQFAREYGLPDVLHVPTGFVSDKVPDAVRAIVTHEPRPEVIIADSDLLAVSALQALAEHGLAVPDDIGVVSFDDSALCSLVSPPLTALDRRPAELGRAAARLAVDGLAAQRVQRIPAAQLQVRGSAGRVGGPSGRRGA